MKPIPALGLLARSADSHAGSDCMQAHRGAQQHF